MDDNSSSWTAIEVDPDAVTPSGLLGGTPIVVDEPAQPEPETERRGLGSGSRLLVQVAVVLGSALAVGLGVFFLIGAIAGPDDDAPTPSGALDDQAIEPAPGVQENSSRSASRRTDADGEPVDGSRADGLLSGPGSTLEVAGVSTDLEANGASGNPLGETPGGQAAAGSSTTASSTTSSTTTSSTPASTTSTTASSTTTTPSTSATTTPTSASSTVTSAPSTSSASSTSTTRQTTTSTVSTTTTTRPTTQRTTTSVTVTQPTTTRLTTSTTVRTTTTRLTTTTQLTTTTRPTTTTSLPPTLIASPADGAVIRWESNQTFRVNAVPGAAKYCWTISANGDQDRRCAASLSYSHSAGALDPGPTVIAVEALAGNGDSLMSEEVTISLRAATVLTNPDEGDEIDMDRNLPLRSKSIRTADKYCWVLIQSPYNSGNLCADGNRLNVSVDFMHDAGLDDGPAIIIAKAYRGSTMIGRHAINITIEHH